MPCSSLTQECLDPCLQNAVVAARCLDEQNAGFRRLDLTCDVEDRGFIELQRGHFVPRQRGVRIVVQYPVRKTDLESTTNSNFLRRERSEMAVTFGRIDFETEPATSIGPVAAGS